MTRAAPHPRSVALTAAGLAAVLRVRSPDRLPVGSGPHVDLGVTPAGEAWLALQQARERALAAPTLDHRRAQWCAYRTFLALFDPAETPDAIDARHFALADYGKRLGLTAEDLRCVTP